MPHDPVRTALSFYPRWQQIGAMDTLTKAVKEAIEKAPGTTRALAEEAGVAHTTLARIISGERSASVDTARRIIEVLTAWSRRCDHGVTRIQRVIQTVEETK